MQMTWDGVTLPDTVDEHGLRARNDLADAARRHDWPYLLDRLGKDHAQVNATRPGGTSLYTPLHQAAHGGAPAEVVERMIGMGAWRTLQNARGERALDVAVKRGQAHLRDILVPVLGSMSPSACCCDCRPISTR